MLLMIADVLPVERDVGILRLDFSQHIGVECPAPNANATWRPKHVQNPRALTMSLAVKVHQIRGLVATLVPDHTQERHSALLALLRP
jgi:hypothetical protein